MSNVQSFLRGELRQNVRATDAVPFDLKVSKVPATDNQYLTLDPDTDSEEIVYFTTRTGDAGGPGTVHITARGFSSSDSTTDADLQFSHSVNSPFKGAVNHIVLNDKISGSDGGTIADTKALNFGADAYIKTTDDGTNLKFKDGSNTETTLSDILGLTGADGKLMNSSGDTTRGYLDDKLAVSGTGLVKTKTNPGANEVSTLSLGIASTAEAQAGTDDAKPMTAKKVKDSIDYRAGAASDAEVLAGTSSKFVSAAQASKNWQKLPTGYSISISGDSGVPSQTVYTTVFHPAKGGMVNVVGNSGSNLPSSNPFGLQVSDDGVSYSTAFSFVGASTDRAESLGACYMVRPGQYVRGFCTKGYTYGSPSVSLYCQELS